MSAIRYMMATKATHQLGDISSDEPDLCMIHGETDSDFIGNWVTGLGYINVRFPKETTRDLTEEERTKYNRLWVRVGSQPAVKINIP